MEANEVKSVEDLKVWFGENLSPLSIWTPDIFDQSLRQLIAYEMVGAKTLKTRVKIESRADSNIGWNLVVETEAAETFLPNYEVAPRAFYFRLYANEDGKVQSVFRKPHYRI